jgi:nicotinamide-nucleotide amidase
MRQFLMATSLRRAALFLGMNVEIINTGSELMLGRVLNTHQQWLCRRLANLGHLVTRQVAIADTGEAIRTGRARSLEPRGSGHYHGWPSMTCTRELIAELLGKKLVESPEVRAHVNDSLRGADGRVRRKSPWKISFPPARKFF